MSSRPIGIFDSGLGGLTVVNALMKTLPAESFIYLGDTARMPYGEKDANTIRTYGRQLVNFLQQKNVKAIIAACGTVSSNTLWEPPIIDVVRPGIDACIRLNKKRIGVIATQATVNSGFFQRMFKEKAPSLDVDVKPCPLFVPLIEEGITGHGVIKPIAKAYLQDYLTNPVDALVLGCTHYPLLAPVLSEILGDIPLIDMAIATVESTREFLSENDLLNESSEPSYEFFVSAHVGKFNELGKQITGLSIKAQKLEIINLQD